MPKTTRAAAKAAKNKRPTDGPQKVAAKKKKQALKTKRRQAAVLPAWRLFGVGIRTLWSVKKYSGLILLLHLLLIVFVTNRDTTQTQMQIYISLSLLVFMSMMYVTLLRAEAKDKKQLSYAAVIYQGPAQIVPFLCLLSLTVLQILPFAFGALIFQIVISANIAILAWEQIAFGILWFVMSLPSLYWLSSTLMALIIVTLPGVRPLEAYQAAKNLVHGYTFRVASRMLVFTVVALALIFGGVIGAFALGREVFAFQMPNYALAGLVPLFWAYTFALYRDLLAHE